MAQDGEHRREDGDRRGLLGEQTEQRGEGRIGGEMAGLRTDEAHAEKEETERETRLGGAALAGGTQQVESGETGDEEDGEVVEDAQRDELHGGGDAGIGGEKKDEGSLDGKPAGAEQLEREEGLRGGGRGHDADTGAREGGATGAVRETIEPQVQRLAEEPVEAFAKEANAEQDERDARCDVEKHHGG